MSRSRFLVTYDIQDDKRLRQVFKIMRGFGDHVQYSVFVCDLNPRERIQLEFKLRQVVHHHQDQVLFFRLGSVDRDLEEIVDSIGRNFFPPNRVTVI